MSGILNALASSNGIEVSVAVTLEFFVNYTGYDTSPVGSVAPNPFNLKGIQVTALKSDNAHDFIIQINSNIAQNYWRTVRIQRASGYRVYSSTSATSFITGGGVTSWLYGDASSPVWVSGDNATVKNVTFVY